ncbi:MAG: hypothetical protein WCK51_01400 [Armatimonadota bacterium]
MRFATIAGVISAVGAGAFFLFNRESNTSTFEQALNRMSGQWTGTAQMFLPDGKQPVLQGTIKFDGKAREYRLVADFIADEATRKAMSAENQNANITITKFLRLTPKGTFTLDESPIEFDDLAGFAASKTQILKLVGSNPQYCEVVEFKNVGTNLEISVATGKDKKSVKPNVVFRMTKVQA